MERVVLSAVVASSMLLAACSGGTGQTSEPARGSSSQSAVVSQPTGPGSGSHAGGQDARDAGRSPDPGAFGASCTSGSDCESNVCFSGGKGGFCSLACTSDAQCPAGADGTQHCNPHGYCRY